MIHCFLHVNGARLSDPLKDALYRAACVMLRNGRTEHRLQHDDGQAELVASGEQGFVGCMVGPIVHADGATAKGVFDCVFIVLSTDYASSMEAPWWKYDHEDGVWVDGHGGWME